MIQVRGIFETDCTINGSYFKNNESHNGRVYYHNLRKDKHIYWNDHAWFISDEAGDDTFYAHLLEDIIFPTLATKHWLIWDVLKNRFVEDKSIEVEKDVTNQFFSKIILMCLFLIQTFNINKNFPFLLFFLEGEGNRISK